MRKKCKHFAQDKLPGSEKKEFKVFPSTNTDSAFPFLRKANSPACGLNKIHIFLFKILIRSEYCQSCGVKIKFGKIAMRYNECKIICHPKCKSHFPLPCIPLPVKASGAGKKTILV